ncbi:MAG: hypothetical protein V1927_04535 [Candidatus Omnitrophota bacterium]
MEKKWYQKTAIQVAIISGIFILIAAIVPLFLTSNKIDTRKDASTFPVKSDNNKIVSAKQTGNGNTIIQTNDNSMVNLTMQKTQYANVEVLRKLKPLETGKDVSELPSGIYGFSVARAIVYGARYPGDKYLTLSNKKYGSFFEIQKVKNECFVIGYIGDEAYANIGKVKTANSVELTLSPSPWGSIKNVVSIPLKAILKIEDRVIDIDEDKNTTVLDMVTTTILTNVYEHEK